MSPAKTSIWAYLSAAVGLYGQIPLEEILKLYNQHNDPMDAADFLACALELENAESPFVLLSEQHIYAADAKRENWQVTAPHLVYAGWDNLFTLEAAQENIPLCVLSEEEFLAYKDPSFMPYTPQLQEMLIYLKEHVGYSGEPEQLLEEVYQQAREDHRPDTCLQELQRKGAEFGDLSRRRTFVQLYQDVSDTVRKPALRGYTQKELADLPIPQERKEQRFYAWFCSPVQRDKPIPDSVLRQNISSCGESARQRLSIRATCDRELPPRLYDLCFCGSNLYYTDCCGKR